MSGNRSSMIDWDLAVLTASNMSSPSPTVSRAEVEAAVTELRAGAERSTPLVREFTGPAAPGDTARTRSMGTKTRPSPSVSFCWRRSAAFALCPHYGE